MGCVKDTVISLTFHDEWAIRVTARDLWKLGLAEATPDGSRRMIAEVVGLVLGDASDLAWDRLLLKGRTSGKGLLHEEAGWRDRRVLTAAPLFGLLARYATGTIDCAYDDGTLRRLRFEGGRVSAADGAVVYPDDTGE